MTIDVLEESLQAQETKVVGSSVVTVPDHSVRLEAAKQVVKLLLSKAERQEPQDVRMPEWAAAEEDDAVGT